MNEFAINWLKGGEYAEITVPSGSALKSKLLKYSQERPDEVKMEVWSAMLRSAISMLLRQERYLKSSEPPQKNVSVKCGKKKRQLENPRKLFWKK